MLVSVICVDICFMGEEASVVSFLVFFFFKQKTAYEI